MSKYWCNPRPFERIGGNYFYDIYETWCGRQVIVWPWYFNSKKPVCLDCEWARNETRKVKT